MGGSILVVEGDCRVHMLLQEWLKTVFRRYEVFAAEDEAEATHLAEAQSPRMILADIDLSNVADIGAYPASRPLPLSLRSSY